MNLRGRRTRGDDGIVIILFAVALFAVMAMVAIAVDLGQLRATRRSNESVSDLAALSAGFFLSGRGSTTATPDSEAACRAAINSVQTNLEGDWSPTLSGADITNACAPLPTYQECITGAVTTPVTVTVTRGAYKLTVRYWVPNSEIIDSRRQGGLGPQDGTNACQRMRVGLDRNNDTFFAGVLGVNDLAIGANAVVRANSSVSTDGVAALLLLERVACGALQTSGGGSSGSGVVVQASSATNPGVIQADSAGQVPPCTTNNNANGWVMFGTALPAAGGGGPSIIAEPAANGTQGIIGIRALAVGGRGGYTAPTGISPQPDASEINSRQTADNKYNRPLANGGAAQISTFHAEGWNRTTGSMPGSPYVALDPAHCSGLDTAVTTTYAAATHLFVDCPVFAPATASFPAATHVIFKGKVDVANGALLSLPNVQRVYVRGCVSSCSGGNFFALRVAGELRVNTGGDGTAAPACSDPGRLGPGVVGPPAGTNTNWTALGTFNGPFLVTGQVRLCQTFVYLGRNDATYARQSQTATGVAPENYPAIAACAPTLPCPSNTGGPAKIDISGGGGTADWTAPNQLTATPTVADFATHPFEDLALWAETSEASFIKGQGANRTEGVYFLPNASVTFTGQATQSQPLNAQFFSRFLNVSGQGSLHLKPNPADSIPIRIPGAVTLIR